MECTEAFCSRVRAGVVRLYRVVLMAGLYILKFGRQRRIGARFLEGNDVQQAISDRVAHLFFIHCTVFQDVARQRSETYHSDFVFERTGGFAQPALMMKAFSVCIHASRRGASSHSDRS